MSKEKIKEEEEKTDAPASKEESVQEMPKELQELIEAGVHFGHKKSIVHPGMFPYIFCTRNNTHIIDVAKTNEKLNEALEYIKTLAKEGKTVLLVGTRLPVREAVKSLAEETKMPYAVNRWYGGTLTNWNTIQERIQFLKDLKEKKKSSEWKKYPKHERMEMEKKIAKLENVLGGIEKMEKLPDAVFLVDLKENHTAAREAKKIGIPTIGIVDTNINPSDVDYPIPANDDALTSVQFILDKVKGALK